MCATRAGSAAGRVLDGELNLVGALQRASPTAQRTDSSSLVRDDDVDARPARARERRACGVEILLRGPREHGDRRRGHRRDDRANALGVTRGARLDDVDAQPLELRGDLGPLLGLQGEPGDDPPSRNVVSKIWILRGDTNTSFLGTRLKTHFGC